MSGKRREGREEEGKEEGEVRGVASEGAGSHKWRGEKGYIPS